MHVLLSATAYAKLNLALHVTGQRADGYHLLDSLVVFTRYGDALSVTAAAEDSFTLSGIYANQVPVSGDNLVLKARDVLRAHYPDLSAAVAIHLEKNLPVASGIGGGSSDAATVLVLLMRLWKISAESADLNRLCLALGADVPMCMHGQIYSGGVIAKGIGEDLQHVQNLPELPLVLINDMTALSTPQIFKNLHKRDNPPLPKLPGLTTISDLCDYLTSTRNDLYAPAASLAPQLPRILNILDDSGAKFTQMSGSGATCLGIYDTIAQAQHAAAQLRHNYPHWFIQATSTVTASALPQL